MKLIIILIIVFLTAMYLFTYLKRKKSKKNLETMNSVEQYHQNYTQRRVQMQKRRDAALKPNNYITKYNSSEDYREK